MFCDPNNKPTYQQAAARKGPDGKALFVSADPTKTISNGIKISDDGHFLIEAAADRKFEKRTYMLPLPLQEMILNPNLVQNPFWN